MGWVDVLFNRLAWGFFPGSAMALAAVCAVALLVFAPWLVAALSRNDLPEDSSTFRVNALRGFIALALLAGGAFHPGALQTDALQSRAPGFIRFFTFLFTAYLFYIVFFAIGHFMRFKYGEERERKGALVRVDSYRSRTFALTARAVLVILTLTILFDALATQDIQKTSAVIAFVVGFVVLSQGSWVPDYISGLIILSSEIFREGDTVKLNDANETFLGEIFRIRTFHTEILSAVDNHRVMIRNSRMREFTIHNLSKFASAKGLRENLSFKIGYDVPASQVHAMLESAFKNVCENSEVDIQDQHPPEIRVQEAGDHAVEWLVYFYTTEPKRLNHTRQAFTASILQASIESGISLSTPMTHVVDIGQAAAGLDVSRVPEIPE